MNIESARKELSDRCDGPIDAFTLMARACDLVANKESSAIVAADALYEELNSRGFLRDGFVEVPGS